MSGDPFAAFVCRAGRRMSEKQLRGTDPASQRSRAVGQCTCSLLALCLLFFVAFSPLALAADPGKAKNVLVLYSFSKRDNFDSLQPLQATLRSRAPTPVNFYVEYLESQRFRSRGYTQDLSDTLHDAYAGQKWDLVVVVAYPALQFALEFRDRMFPGVPIVFMSVAPARIQGHPLWPGVTGVTIPLEVRGTLDLALRLHPDLKNVAVVAGDSEFESYWLAATSDEVRQHADRLNVIRLVALPVDQLLQNVSTLPPHTVVFFELIPQDSSHAVIGTFDVLAGIAQRFPTYCIHNYCFDHGAIGGAYPDDSEQGVKGGELAARVLSGEKPENIPIVHGSHVQAQVDWRQLRRWNIAESVLPPGTVVLYRQPTAWAQYKTYIIAGIVLILLQALLIAGLLWLRARKRKTEAVLRESEKRFRVMADTTPSLVWMCDKDGEVTYLNNRRIEFTGRDVTAGFADTWTAYIHPDDVQEVQAANERALEQQKAFSKEYRLRRRDGVYRWMLDVAAPRINGDGSFAGFIGAAVDMTDQKLAQEALEQVSGKLIEAQETERRRIARELHDDICQRLAMLTLELEQASEGSNGSASRLLQIRERYSEIALDIQAISHELHSSKLEYLGIVAGLRTFCEEFSEQHSVEIDFSYKDVPAQLPREASLCLFRVAQEALHNAVKYSGKGEFSVRLLGTTSEVELEVRDRGAGFDVETARRGRGLGLMSMQERIHLVKGFLAIESSPNGGTRVIARVPVATLVASPTITERVQRM